MASEDVVGVRILSDKLFAACKRGDSEQVARLLLRDANVNARDDQALTPLHWSWKHVRVATLLLDAGAEVDARGDNMRTCLHGVHSLEMARLLIKRGAQLTAVDEDGQNALHLRARCDELEMCLFLVSRGLDPNTTDNEGETALTLYGSWVEQDDIPPSEDETEGAIVQLLAAREAYEQRVRDEHWKKNWPLLNTLTSSGLRPMAVEVAALAAQQAASDKSIKLPGIPRITKAQNIAFLNQVNYSSSSAAAAAAAAVCSTNPTNQHSTPLQPTLDSRLCLGAKTSTCFCGTSWVSFRACASRRARRMKMKTTIVKMERETTTMTM